jgi:aminodeoxychorismate lyase
LQDPLVVLVNGVECETVNVRDRGLLYGDGLFETIGVYQGQPQLWERHMRRLQQGCSCLGIPAPDPAVLHREAQGLCKNCPRAVIKIIVTRGIGGRGYRPLARVQGTRIVGLHAWPDYPESNLKEGVAVRLCATRLGSNPALAGIKHLNRLEQVLARAEWDDPEVPEGLMLDREGRVIEGTMSNVFAVRNGVVITPDVSESGVAGIMRALILETCKVHSIAQRVTVLCLEDLKSAEELFICNSLIGVWPVRTLDGVAYRLGPLTHRIIRALGCYGA